MVQKDRVVGKEDTPGDYGPGNCDAESILPSAWYGREDGRGFGCVEDIVAGSGRGGLMEDHIALALLRRDVRLIKEAEIGRGTQ